MVLKLLKIIPFLLLLSCGSAWATDYTQNANCQGAWLMEVDEDPIRDSSTNSNTGALTSAGNPDYSTTSPPKAYSTGFYVFDGVGDVIDCGNDSSLHSASFSVVSWLRCDNLSNNVQGMVGTAKGSGSEGFTIDYDFHKADGLSFNVYGATDGEAEANDNLTTAWTHAVGVFDGTNVTLNIGGVLQTDTGTAGHTPGTQNFKMGPVFSDIANYYLEGALDE